MNRRQFLVAAVASGVGAGLSQTRSNISIAKPGGVKTGGNQMISIAKGKYRVWTRRVGESHIKILLLHGGPGLNHMYLECFDDFLPQHGIEFYYYDQLGSLFSDNPEDPNLWTIERYTDEVEQVRIGLGLDNFYLYGHSWGGMLGYEYALKYGQHLKGLVISDMVASVPGYIKYVNGLRNKFPSEVVESLERYEAEGNFDAPQYQKMIFEQLYARHLCRLDPWPEPVERSLRFFNTKIYNYMQGPNEFVITGTFKDWDRTEDLKHIKTRTLVLGARYDTMDPEEMRRIATAMPNARAAISTTGSHLCMYDDQEWYFRQLISFLKGA